MDKEDKDVRVAHNPYADFPGLLADKPMTVVETPWNTKLISYWTRDTLDGQKLRYEEIPGTDHRFMLLRRTHPYPPVPRLEKLWGPRRPLMARAAAVRYNGKFARYSGPSPNASDVIMPSVSAAHTPARRSNGLAFDYTPWVVPFVPRQDTARANHAAKPVEHTAYFPPQRAGNTLYTASDPAIPRHEYQIAPATLPELVNSSFEDSKEGTRRHAAVLQTELDALNCKIAELDLERKRHIKEYQRMGKNGKNLKNMRKNLEKQRDALMGTEARIVMGYR